MKKYLWIFIAVSLLSCARVYADAPATTGIIAGQIWYSQDPLVEGDTVKIYTAVWNGDDNPLSARVEFYDQNVILGTRDVTVPPQSLSDVSVSWKVTAGDHIIKASIISSSVTASGKKQTVTLDRNSTAEDRTHVSVVVKNSNGTPAKSVDIIENQVANVGAKIEDIIPPSVTSSVSSIDAARGNTYTTIAAAKADTQKKITALNAAVKSETVTTPKKGAAISADTPSNKNAIDATQKPLQYIKLFFLSVLAFIFGYKIVFYGLSIFIIYLVLRFLYRKIRNRD